MSSPDRSGVPGDGRTAAKLRSGAMVGGVLNGASLGVIAMLGLANGLYTAGISVWRVLLFPLLALLAYVHTRLLDTRGAGWILAGVALTSIPLGLLVAPASLAATPPEPGDPSGTLSTAFWESVTGLLSLAVVVVLPWLAGRSRRQQHALVRAGQRELEQLKREREYDSERARMRERSRIATDVHDYLGSELALMALRAGGLELSPNLSEPHRQAAEDLRVSAVRATDRLRHTIGMLREDAVGVQPPAETVTALVERAAAAGMDVQLSGVPQQLPAHVDRTMHRVIQEALTNAARYAPGSEVTVTITLADEALTVVVANDHTEAAGACSGSGSGLLELAERVRVLGGEFNAGADARGFTVTARLPLGWQELT